MSWGLRLSLIYTSVLVALFFWAWATGFGVRLDTSILMLGLLANTALTYRRERGRQPSSEEPTRSGVTTCLNQ